MSHYNVTHLTWINVINNSVTFSSLNRIEGKTTSAGNNHNFPIWWHGQMWGSANMTVLSWWQQMRVFSFIILNCNMLKKYLQTLFELILKFSEMNQLSLSMITRNYTLILVSSTPDLYFATTYCRRYNIPGCHKNFVGFEPNSNPVLVWYCR
jgi:mannosyltransferase OCH1-like enzyme